MSDWQNPIYEPPDSTPENPPEYTPAPAQQTPAATTAASVDRTVKPRRKISIPEITTQDLNPEALAFKLNLVLKLVADVLARGQGNAGPFQFGAGPLRFSGATYLDGLAEVKKLLRLVGESDRDGNICPLEFSQDLPEYADNTAALAGGLTAGKVYRTAAGAVMVVI